MTDYTKLIERLREIAGVQGFPTDDLVEAAEAIEALQGEVERLKRQLNAGKDVWRQDQSRIAELQAKLDELQRQEPVAWFAFGESNGPVPLELFGWDEKACKHAVLTNARSVGWKGTLDGYLYQQGWTIKPVYTHAAPKALEPESLTPDERQQVVELLDKEGHDGKDFEPECPLCTARKKLAHGITKGTST